MVDKAKITQNAAELFELIATTGKRYGYDKLILVIEESLKDKLTDREMDRLIGTIRLIQQVMTYRKESNSGRLPSQLSGG